jgi:hypothetical protein
VTALLFAETLADEFAPRLLKAQEKAADALSRAISALDEAARACILATHQSGAAIMNDDMDGLALSSRLVCSKYIGMSREMEAAKKHAEALSVFLVEREAQIAADLAKRAAAEIRLAN